MATIVTRAGKGAPLANAEVDANFTNLNNELSTKAPLGAPVFTGDVTIADKIVHAGDENTSIRFPAADTVTVETGGVEVARIDSSGNLGLGVTPSAFGSGKAIEVGASGISINGLNTSNVIYTCGWYYGGGSNFIRTTADPTTYYQQAAGAHRWFNAPAGTVGTSATFMQAMTLDASGNFYVGATSQSGGSNVTFGQPADADMKIAASVSTGTRASYQVFVNNTVTTVGTENSTGSSLASGTAAYSTVIANNGAYPISFATNNTERMRIDAAGYLGIGTSTPVAPLHVFTSGVGTAVMIESTDDTNVSGPSLVLRRSSPSPAASDYIGQIFFQGMDTAGAATNYARIIGRIEDPTNTSEDGALYFHTTQAGASTTAAIMNSVGDFTATGNITAYSDARLKTNVRTVPDAMALVQQMRGVFFDKDGSPSVGVIAQEMEAVLPEVVHQGEYKSVAYGNIVGVLIEAIKAQQVQIDELKSKLGE